MRPDDAPELVDLFLEMEEFYGEHETPTRVASNIQHALLGPAAIAQALLARVDTKLAGFASYTLLWPALGSTQSLYLKEIYVRAAFRRSGVGQALMWKVKQIAVDLECTRIEWTTEETNEPARAFYASQGSLPHAGKLLYRIDI
jgi:GNAT superfamily N-acetyltransferase